MLYDPFLVLLSGENKRHIWIGLTPDFKVPSLNLFECTAYRAPPQHHASYDVVWCYEVPLDQQGWRIFVDGAVTLLASKRYICTALHAELFYYHSSRKKLFVPEIWT